MCGGTTGQGQQFVIFVLLHQNALLKNHNLTPCSFRVFHAAGRDPAKTPAGGDAMVGRVKGKTCRTSGLGTVLATMV